MPQFWGKILHGVHKRLPVLGLVFEVLKWLFTGSSNPLKTVHLEFVPFRMAQLHCFLFVPFQMAQLLPSHQVILADQILTGSVAYHNDELSC